MGFALFFFNYSKSKHKYILLDVINYIRAQTKAMVIKFTLQNEKAVFLEQTFVLVNHTYL